MNIGTDIHLENHVVVVESPGICGIVRPSQLYCTPLTHHPSYISYQNNHHCAVEILCYVAVKFFDE